MLDPCPDIATQSMLCSHHHQLPLVPSWVFLTLKLHKNELERSFPALSLALSPGAVNSELPTGHGPHKSSGHGLCTALSGPCHGKPAQLAEGAGGAGGVTWLNPSEPVLGCVMSASPELRLELSQPLHRGSGNLYQQQTAPKPLET